MVDIALKHIHKKYDGNDFYSVTDFNLDIKDREFIVFVGLLVVVNLQRLEWWPV